MKTKTMVLCCLASAVVLAMVPAGNKLGQAQPKANTSSLKIGVVSIMKVFRNCKRSGTYRSETIAEQNRIRGDLKELSKQLEAQEAGLKALKRDSSDYLAQRKELIEKRNELEARQEFNKERLALREYKWSKELYQDILQATQELAKQKGLDLVLEKDEVGLLSLSTSELMRTISTNKVLYSGGCVDITDDVVARLDREDSKRRRR